MKKNKWSNLFGDTLAIGTVAVVAFSSKHVAKKYGQKFSGISIDKWYLVDYAFNKFLGDGTKLNNRLNDFIEKSKGE